MKISRQFLTLSTSLVLVGAGALSLSSCGGDDSLSGAGGSMKAASAGAAAAIFLAGNQGINLEMKPDSAPNLTQLGMQGTSFQSVAAEEEDPFKDCASKSPANPKDDDGDGIPLEFTREYDCTDITVQGGYVYSAQGKFTIIDLNDKDKRYMEGGYRYEIDYKGKYENPTFPYTNTYSHQGFYDSRVVGNSYVFKSEFSAGFAGEVKGFPFEGKWRSNYQTVWTPDDANNKWVSGKVAFSGFIALEGNFSHEDEENYNVAWEIGSNGLEYAYGAPSNCTYYKTGTMWWIDGAGQKYEIQYNCNSRKVLFQGQEVSLN
ncbi:MAG: hypothetical protein KF767_16065 [Bdellovibrionaceae bacterium]|nr:hypothetical protein [Pseudobdellovibrionaceae bacterium]